MPTASEGWRDSAPRSIDRRSNAEEMPPTLDIFNDSTFTHLIAWHANLFGALALRGTATELDQGGAWRHQCR